MNTFRIRASKMVRITRGSRVVFTEGQRIKHGTVIEVAHDHYRIEDLDGNRRSILHEKVEALTAPGGTE